MYITGTLPCYNLLFHSMHVHIPVYMYILYIVYLSTEKTRAILPTALILFLITSFLWARLLASSVQKKRCCEYTSGSIYTVHVHVARVVYELCVYTQGRPLDFLLTPAGTSFYELLLQACYKALHNVHVHCIIIQLSKDGMT